MNSWNMKSATLLATMAVAVVGLMTGCPGEEPEEVDEPYFTVTIDEDASTVDVGEGDTVTVEAEVENNGDDLGIQDIDFEIEDVVEETEEAVELEVGETETVSFDWETDEGDAGDYTAEVRSDDNDDTIDVSVDEAADVFFDVELNEEESTLTVLGGETAEAVAYIENTGADIGTQNIVFTIDGEEVAEHEDLELEPGEAANIGLELETDEGDVGEISGQAMSDDDAADFTITVEELTAGTLSGVLTDYETDDTLEGVDVELVDGDDEVVETTTTDADGEYQFEEVDFADYDLELSAPGLHPDYTVEESDNDQTVGVTVDDAEITQDLTLDWLAETDVFIDGGSIEMGFVPADSDDLEVELPGCEDDNGDWGPVMPGDSPDEDVDVSFDPDDACFGIEEAGIGLADGTIDLEAEDVIFPTIEVTVDDEDDDIHEFLTGAEIALESAIDDVGGAVDFNEGELDVDIDVRFLVGGTLNPDGGAPEFGVDAGYDDCQLTGGWGQGDLDEPGDEMDDGDYIHDSIELHLTTGESGSAEGEPFDESTGVFVTVNDEAEVGRLSEGQYGEDDGGAACGYFEHPEDGDDVDFAGFINDMVMLPAEAGDVSSEFDFLIP